MAVAKICLSPLLALVAGSVLEGQENPPRNATVVVAVVDTGINRPSRPFIVTATVPVTEGSRTTYRGVGATSVEDGRYRFENLAADSVTVDVGCPTVAGATKWKKRLAFRTRANSSIDTTVIVDHAGCDMRPVRTERRVFTGLFTPGVESSRFIPCPRDSWILPADSLNTYARFRPGAWVYWERNDSTVYKSVRWPAIDRRDNSGNATWFVRWRGTVTGPGQYGHLGGSPFQLVVDSIISVAVPNDSSCSATQ